MKSLQVFDSAEASKKPRRTLVEWDRQQAFHAYSDADLRLIIYSTAIIKVHIDFVRSEENWGRRDNFTSFCGMRVIY